MQTLLGGGCCHCSTVGGSAFLVIESSLAHLACHVLARFALRVNRAFRRDIDMTNATTFTTFTSSTIHE
jgi:hypothetical protein